MSLARLMDSRPARFFRPEPGEVDFRGYARLEPADSGNCGSTLCSAFLNPLGTRLLLPPPEHGRPAGLSARPASAQLTVWPRGRPFVQAAGAPLRNELRPPVETSARRSFQAGRPASIESRRHEASAGQQLEGRSTSSWPVRHRPAELIGAGPRATGARGPALQKRQSKSANLRAPAAERRKSGQSLGRLKQGAPQQHANRAPVRALIRRRCGSNLGPALRISAPAS